MVEYMVVVREVVAGDDIDAGIFLNLPMLKSKAFALGEELIL